MKSTKELTKLVKKLNNILVDNFEHGISTQEEINNAHKIVSEYIPGAAWDLPFRIYEDDLEEYELKELCVEHDKFNKVKIKEIVDKYGLDTAHIAFYGPIGVGKSTISTLIKEAIKTVSDEKIGYMNEPVTRLKHKLAKFYEAITLGDKKTIQHWAYICQSSFFTELIFDMDKLKELKGVVYDSCFLSNVVFTELLYREGDLNSYQLATLHGLVKSQLTLLGHVNYFCLHRPKEKMIENQNQRGRDVEAGADEYLNFHWDNYYKVAEKMADYFEVNKDPETRLQHDLMLGHKEYDESNIHELLDEIGRKLFA